MTGTAESDVFEEVGTTFLLLCFLYGTYPHDQPELYSGCRRSIVQDKIVQSVGKASLYRPVEEGLEWTAGRLYMGA